AALGPASLAGRGPEPVPGEPRQVHPGQPERDERQPERSRVVRGTPAGLRGARRQAILYRGAGGVAAYRADRVEPPYATCLGLELPSVPGRVARSGGSRSTFVVPEAGTSARWPRSGDRERTRPRTEPWTPARRGERPAAEPSPVTGDTGADHGEHRSPHPQVDPRARGHGRRVRAGRGPAVRAGRPDPSGRERPDRPRGAGRPGAR